MGGSRDDLLYQVHKPQEVSNVTGRKAVEQIDTVQMEHHFAAMIKEVDEIILSLDKMLQEDDQAERERIR